MSSINPKSPGCSGNPHRDSFCASIRAQDLDVSEWGKGGKKSIEELYWEVVMCRESILTGLKTLGRLKRVTRFVKIRLTAEISGVRHILFSRMQFRHDGHVNEEKRMPLRKLQWLERYVGSNVD